MKRTLIVLSIYIFNLPNILFSQEKIKRFEFNAGYGAYVDMVNLAYGYGFNASDDVGTNVWCALNYKFNKKWSIEAGYMRFTDPRRDRIYYEEIPNQVVIDLNFRQLSYAHFPYLSFARVLSKNKSTFKIGLGLNLEHNIYQQYDIVNDIRFFPKEVPRVIVRDYGRGSKQIEIGALLNIDYQWSPNPYYHLGVKFLTSYTFSSSFYQYLTLSPYIGIKF